MYNGKKPPILIIDDLEISLKELKELKELNKLLDIINPKVEYDFPLIFGTSGPDYIDPCLNCRNNPKNNPNASGNCCCSLPSRNITY